MIEENSTIDINNDYYFYEIVRKNIKKYRKEKGLTQEQLAEKIDITHDYMTKIESNKTIKRFTIGIVGKISIVLNIEFYKFFIEDKTS